MNDAELSQASNERLIQGDGTGFGISWGRTVYREPQLADPVFVVLWHDGNVTTTNNSWVSEAYDMADCDYMEGVKQIFAVNEKCELVPITVGESHPINQDQEEPFRYASAPIMAGERQVGCVTLTDH